MRSSAEGMRANRVFVTATGTGVGKTLLTALLLRYLARLGMEPEAMKPFCTGARDDVRTLQAALPAWRSEEHINPFFYEAPLAPWAASRHQGKPVPLTAARASIEARDTGRTPFLIEGVGGVMVPLGKGYCVRELIGTLHCHVLVVAPNRLGVLNETLLTLEALREVSPRPPRIVLMGQANPDSSARSNADVLAAWAAPSPVFSFPFLGQAPSPSEALEKNQKNFTDLLAEILPADILSMCSGQCLGRQGS